MATTQNVVDRLREICGDVGGNVLTDAIAVNWLNIALDELAAGLNLFTEEEGLFVTQYSPFVSLPSDFSRVRSLLFKDYRPIFPLNEINLEDAPLTFSPDQSGSPTHYFVETIPGSNLLRLRLWPMPDTADITSTLNGAISSSVTAATLAALTSFEGKGIVKVDSEQMLFLATDSSLVQLTRIARGYANTTAASHSSGATVTQASLILRYVRTVTALAAASMSATVEWPDRYRMALCHYAAGIFYLATQEDQKAAVQFQVAGFKEGRVRNELINKQRTSLALPRRRGRLTDGRAGGLQPW